MNITRMDLPAPGPFEAAHSERLQDIIRREIAGAGGRITFARYMELALYAPGLGYYSAGLQKFGAGGDFVTAPEISPLFARCIARQCQQVLEQIEQGNILEVGAGSGALACDVLSECEYLGCLPQHYFILELSAELRARQRDALTQRVPHLAERVCWLDTLPERGFHGVVLANEVLDAMPLHRVRIDGDAVYECYVGYEGGYFVWRHGPIIDAALAGRIAAVRSHVHDLPQVFESEVSLAASAWIRSIADVMERGLVLLIDYGHARNELYHAQRADGTLLCHYRHRTHADPLILTGLQDITAQVDFTAVAEAAHDAGLTVAGYTTQAHFLLACGLMEMAADADASDAATYLPLMQQVKKLTQPDEMGETFKVIALTRGINAPLRGFALMDYRGRL